MFNAGGVVAVWSEVLFKEENKRKLEDPRFDPRPLQQQQKINARYIEQIYRVNVRSNICVTHVWMC